VYSTQWSIGGSSLSCSVVVTSRYVACMYKLLTCVCVDVPVCAEMPMICVNPLSRSSFLCSVFHNSLLTKNGKTNWRRLTCCL